MFWCDYTNDIAHEILNSKIKSVNNENELIEATLTEEIEN